MSSAQMSRIDRNRDMYETWPLEIRQAVLDAKGNVMEAARKLGISRATVYRRLGTKPVTAAR